MKAIVKARAGPGLELRDVPRPVPGPGEVLVKVDACSICGTDLHIYLWDKWSEARIAPPRTIGHEMAGHVVELGKGASKVREGDYVTSDSHLVCGNCFQCKTGQAHVCEDYKILGVDVDGCFADYVRVPETSLWRNPASMPPRIASLQDPFGNAVMSTLNGEIACQSVLVVGCGVIGLMAVAIARASGASEVIGVDINPYRLKLAQSLGAHLVFDGRSDWLGAVRNATGGKGADVVLEMSGNAGAIKTCLKAARNGGRVSLLGIPSEPVEIDLANDVVFKALRVDGVTGRKMWDTWYKTSALVGGILDLSPLITHQMDMEDFATGFELMKEGKCGKVVMYPAGMP